MASISTLHLALPATHTKKNGSPTVFSGKPNGGSRQEGNYVYCVNVQENMIAENVNAPHHEKITRFPNLWLMTKYCQRH